MSKLEKEVGISIDKWNPEQYARFQAERAAPFWDLFALVRASYDQRWLDLGCGSGELTRELHLKRTGGSADCGGTTLGIDSSSNMLARATALTAVPGLRYAEAAIEDYSPEGGTGFDVIFANASLQWCSDHKVLLPQICRWLVSGGQLAVQMPMNFDHPAHTMAGEIARDYGVPPRQPPVLAPEAYAELLWRCGLRNVYVGMRVYLHPLASAGEVIEWVKGTLLTYYEERMSRDAYAQFLKEYAYKFTSMYPAGNYLFTFKRVFLYGRQT